MNPTKQYNLIFYLWQKNKRKEQKVKKKDNSKQNTKQLVWEFQQWKKFIKKKKIIKYETIITLVYITAASAESPSVYA